MTAEAKHLPVMKTTFCEAEVRLFDGLSFYLDGNSKITAGNGTYAEPKPNAFSLPAESVSGGGNCPGSTAVCRASCYVKGLQKHAPALYAKYISNAIALERCLATDVVFYTSALKLAQWVEEHARGGFRWHVSGDVQSVRHAEWIAEVCGLAPDVSFWIYTRTFSAIPALVVAHNLTVNVSADADNYADARTVAKEHGLTLCYLTEDGTLPDLPPGSVIFPDYALRGRDLPDPTAAPWWRSLTAEQKKQTCPTDFFGQSESARCGPCRKCL